jgi:hypothetical protein
MSNRVKYLLIAIGSFLVGFIYYAGKNRKQAVDGDFNKTLAKTKNGHYFLVFNNIVVLSREITKEQYEAFLKQYPTGQAPNNVLDDFSTPPDKFTIDNGKYYEAKWTPNGYGQRIEITKEEYEFLTTKNREAMFVAGYIGHI